MNHNHVLQRCMRLPFDLQMQIMRFMPQLPHKPVMFWKMMCAHYETRICFSCGEFIQRRREKGYCLCRKRRYKYTTQNDSIERFVHERPLAVVPYHAITLKQYDAYIEHVECIKKARKNIHKSIDNLVVFLDPLILHETVYIFSRQPVFLFSLDGLCSFKSYPRDIKLNKKTGTVLGIRNIVNTHSFPKNFIDTFRSGQISHSFSRTMYRYPHIVSSHWIEKKQQTSALFWNRSLHYIACRYFDYRFHF